MLWSGGTFTPLRALTGIDLGDAMLDGFNDRGQIAAHWLDGTRRRNVILTPRR